jgi:hypothetical protein
MKESNVTISRALIVVALSFVYLNVFADANTASEESVKQLLDITEARRTVDKMADDLTASVASGTQTLVAQALGNQPPNQEQQKIFDSMQVKIIELIRGEYTWSKFEPVYTNIYRASFTQSEIDGMLAFYKTPAGQAVIKKMPGIAQATVAAIGSRAQPVTSQIKKIEEDAITEARAQGPKN